MMDIVAAKELKNSSLWKEVENEIDFRVSALKNQLITCKDEDLITIRTKILTYEDLKNMPETVIERDA
jgi:hypothetical protein